MKVVSRRCRLGVDADGADYSEKLAAKIEIVGGTREPRARHEVVERRPVGNSDMTFRGHRNRVGVLCGGEKACVKQGIEELQGIRTLQDERESATRVFVAFGHHGDERQLLSAEISHGGEPPSL
ncbi:MAG: hypothetical protein OXK79_05515 [Chloroflexota bacterium]|nr:hypothetical protein [Chloroflexota bacterium]